MGNQDITKNAIGQQTKDLLRKKTIEKISVTTICDGVGIDRKTFYRYFKDKYDVVGWIYYHDFFEKMNFLPGLTIWDYFSEIQKQLYTDREFYVNAFKYTGQNSFRNFSKELLMPIIHKDYADCFPTEEMEQYVIEHILDFVFDSCTQWLSRDPCPPPEEFILQFKQMFLGFSRTNSRLLEESIRRDLDT